jgi:hypothetical protein
MNDNQTYKSRQSPKIILYHTNQRHSLLLFSLVGLGILICIFGYLTVFTALKNTNETESFDLGFAISDIYVDLLQQSTQKH